MRILAATLLLSMSVHLYAAPDFVLCYDFGCKSQQSINFNAIQWRKIDALFTTTAASTGAEKQAIRQAIALMEQFSGALSGTSLDKGGNYPGYDIERQMDCIDESTNTFQYLRALQARNLLKNHRVQPKSRRIVWFATHWTAVIEEVETQQLYAVDSWYRDNGEPPYIQTLEDWRKKQSFPKELNPN